VSTLKWEPAGALPPGIPPGEHREATAETWCQLSHLHVPELRISGAEFSASQASKAVRLEPLEPGAIEKCLLHHLNWQTAGPRLWLSVSLSPSGPPPRTADVIATEWGGEPQSVPNRSRFRRLPLKAI